MRVHGAFVSDEEVAEFVEFLKRNGPPKYAENVQNQIEDDAAANSDNDEEEIADGESADDEKLYQKAMGVLRATKRASTPRLCHPGNPCHLRQRRRTMPMARTWLGLCR